MSDLLNQASLVMVPSGYKEDTVYSVVPSDGSGDLSFTRASNGTRVNSAGLVEVCPWNLASDSNSFGGLSAITKTTGQPSPIDSTSGNLLTATGSGEHYSGTASLTVIAGNTYTYSVYGKFVQGVNLALRTVFANGDADISTIWNLNTGALVLNAGDHQNPTITNVGNGWYRCSITYTPASVPAFPLLFRLQMAVGANLSFTATSGDGFVAYGAQINNGAISPYFPTTDRLNVPRLTYQNGGGGCPSLLLEKQSTNYAIYSQDLTQSATSLSGGTVGANVTTSPDGTQNADSFTVNTATSSHAGYYETYNATNGQPFTTSIFLKAGTGRYFLFRAMTDTYSTRFGATIDLQSGTILSTNTSGSATGTASKIENFGNGWYRVSLTINAIGSQMSYVWGASNTATPSLDANLDYAYTGNGTDSYYIWGMTLENSSYPTSYIPTTSSSATRVADLLNTVTLSNVGITNNFTMFFDWSNFKNDISGFVVTCLDSSYSLVWCVYGGTVIIPTSTGTEYPTGLAPRSKFLCKYNGTNVTYFQNGVKYGPFTAATNYSDATYLAPNGDQISQIYKNEMVLFNSALTDAECISLTTL